MTESADTQGFSERFNLCVEGRNLAALARKVGVSPAMIKLYKEGAVPKAIIGANLAVELDVRLDWLFLGKGPMRPNISDPQWPELPASENDGEAILKAVITEIIAFDLKKGREIVPSELGERALALFRIVSNDRQSSRATGKPVSDDPAVEVLRYLKIVDQLAGSNNFE